MEWVAVGFNQNNATIQGASMYMFHNNLLEEYFGTSEKFEFVRQVDWNPSSVSILTGDSAIQFEVPIRSQRFEFLDTEQHLLISYQSSGSTKGFVRKMNFYQSGNLIANEWGLIV
jgi:type VI protein secretion system component VasA